MVGAKGAQELLIKVVQTSEEANRGKYIVEKWRFLEKKRRAREILNLGMRIIYRKEQWRLVENGHDLYSLIHSSGDIPSPLVDANILGPMKGHVCQHIWY